MAETIQYEFGGKVCELRKVLAIPNNQGLQRRLEAKLEEYRQRLNDPELTPHREATTNYKIWILQQLLDRPWLDFDQVKSAVSTESADYSLSMAYLVYAWKVIENYCYNEGLLNRGGTGLPNAGAEIWTPATTEPVSSDVSDSAPSPNVFGAPISSFESSGAAAPVDERRVAAIPMEERDPQPKRSRLPLMTDVPGQADEPNPFMVHLEAPVQPRQPLVLDDEEDAAVAAPFG